MLKPWSHWHRRCISDVQINILKASAMWTSIGSASWGVHVCIEEKFQDAFAMFCQHVDIGDVFAMHCRYLPDALAMYSRSLIVMLLSPIHHLCHQETIGATSRKHRRWGHFWSPLPILHRECIESTSRKLR